MVKTENETDYPNIIGQGTVLKGEIVFDESVIVDGRVEGTLQVNGSLVIGEHADIKADITATNIQIKGKTNGKISCSGLLSLMHTADCRGDIQTVLLSVEEGTLLHGNVNMKKQNDQIEMIPTQENEN